jgi:hypothetical protein
MRKIIFFLFFICTIHTLTGCRGSSVREEKIIESSLVNTKHLDHLYLSITFPSGVNAAGIYIYSEAPDYHLVADDDEGFTCVDDVSRATLVYLRSKDFATNTTVQTKAINLLRFILEMQSANGYFYNFLFAGNTINKAGKTSVNEANWWSWRALQTLTEASPLIKSIDSELENKINTAVKRLVEKLKSDLLNTSEPTKVVNGITVPQWLPGGSATDQSAIIILGLIQYNQINNDALITTKIIKKLADGIVMMQKGDSANFPYACFLSWENVWHAYGNDQAYALFKAAKFLNDTMYSNKALSEVNNFYPWLLKNGFRSSFYINKEDAKFKSVNEKKYAQIAYGIRPMVFAAAEAYQLTGEKKYAEIAGQLGAWLLGANEAGIKMYDSSTGRCYDGIVAKDSVNYNSGAESTIEALLTLEEIEKYPAIRSALDKYKKQ